LKPDAACAGSRRGEKLPSRLTHGWIAEAQEQRGGDYEEDVPTAQDPKEKNARIQEEDENEERTLGVKEKEGKGTQAPYGMKRMREVDAVWHS
jgi:hypothetical protein